MGERFRFIVEIEDPADPPAVPMTLDEVREILDRALHEGYKHTRCITCIAGGGQER